MRDQPSSFSLENGPMPIKLSEWANIAEIIGGIAIVASLIFVGLEVSENTRMVRLTSDRALDQRNLALNVSVANNQGLADILTRGETDRGSLTPTEKMRFDNYCLSRFGGYENVVGNFVHGLVPQDEYEIWARHFKQRFGKPGYREFWLEYRLGYFDNFRTWADEQFGVQSE
jgi:hypothetical protein